MGTGYAQRQRWSGREPRAKFAKAVVGISLGALSGALWALLSRLIVGGGRLGAEVSVMALIVGWIGSAVLFARGASPKKAAGRACLTIALQTFALPTAGVISAVLTVTSPTAYTTHPTVRLVPGGSVALGILGVYSFALGLLCTVAAYVLLRETRQ
jgi:hypothetical protein